MGSTDGLLDGGTIIRAARRQPGVGKLSEPVSDTPGLLLGSLYFVSSGGARWPTVSVPDFLDHEGHEEHEDWVGPE